MTGYELAEIMEKLSLNGTAMGRVAGLTRQRIYQLVALGHEPMPAETYEKIKAGLMDHGYAAMSTVMGGAA